VGFGAGSSPPLPRPGRLTCIRPWRCRLDTAGDGFFATFDGPARAVRCGLAIVDSVHDLGLAVRVGIHTGEVERIDGKVGGIAVSVGARIAALAEQGEVLVSSTVRDLVAGSGLAFDDVGERDLRGLPGTYLLSRARAAPV
jgi:class 3 adenylate cyclase